MLENLRTQTFETTTVRGVGTTIRDTLLHCQHPTVSVYDEVHMDGDYVFDASMDDMLGVDTDNAIITQKLCKELVRAFPQTQMFIFAP